MSAQFDVAIVGGGPAGLASACTLASAGVRVAVLDAGAQSSDRLRRYETLAPTAGETIAALGLARQFSELQLQALDGFQSTWASSRIEYRSSIEMPHGSGWLFDRRAFLELLVNHAARHGTTFFETRLNALRSGRDGWSIATGASERPTLNARFVVYATGRSAPLPGGVDAPHAVDALTACFARLPSTTA